MTFREFVESQKERIFSSPSINPESTKLCIRVGTRYDLEKHERCPNISEGKISLVVEQDVPNKVNENLETMDTNNSVGLPCIELLIFNAPKEQISDLDELGYVYLLRN